MRKFEIDIIVYDKKEAKIKGDENTEDFPSKASIDLDTVTSCWNNGDNEVVVHLKGGESYCAKGIGYLEFCNIWEGTTKGTTKGFSGTPCPCCGVINADCNECDTCGYKAEENE